MVGHTLENLLAALRITKERIRGSYSVAAVMVAKTAPEGLLLLAPADHLIADAAAFRAAVLFEDCM